MTKYRVFEASCGQCKERFRSPSPVPDSGEKVLRSATLKYFAVVDIDGDREYGALWDLANGDPVMKSLMDSQRIRITDLAFSNLCDGAPDESAYSFEFPRTCPKCGSTDFDFGPLEPPQVVELSLPAVSHRRLDAMGNGERLALLRRLSQQA